ncbi:acyl-ACP thioesterase domain-containing protein [Hydrogenoanaerobacterium sp.]|uniref:acyl-[acyl-carrier-protein] thioesterase n=1 Tax=Hydrogenoanaerobacterium sp. TaxID=2953763 RepID=UPI0028A19A10|nr:acyl-ACP thioesterase domain-containing protein [Hydrogenoanaerobacterium sp.]
MQNYEFHKKIKLTYPECDIRNQIKLSGMMRHIQEVSGEHLEELGLSHVMLWNEGFVFLLTKVALQVKRRPGALEKLTIVTKPRAPKGVQSMRDVYFYDEAGEEIIYAQTAWVLTDPIEHKIRRPNELPYTIPLEPVAVDYELLRAKNKRPKDAQPVGKRVVRYSDIDCNMHMNNAVYSDIVCDYLPLEQHRSRDVAQYNISFVGEAKFGDELTVFRAQLDENTYYIGADRPAGDSCFECIIKFK